MYLTRSEAVAKLGGDEEDERLLDHAPEYPRSTRTNFYLITRYPAGSIGRYPDAMNAGELFTVSNW
jgi:hypothetical protein